MKRIGRSLLVVAAIGTLVVGLPGCKNETAEERAAKQLDKAPVAHPGGGALRGGTTH
jgi:hypothetical protein